MKILKIQFASHDVFSNHEVIFGDPDVPEISFLVGNNGSGKTKILDIIHHALVSPFDHPGNYEFTMHLRFSADEVAQLGLPGAEAEYFVSKDPTNGNNYHLILSDGSQLGAAALTAMAKVVFSTIEVNFNESPVNSVTSKNIDDEAIPKAKSLNLSTEIPQLLVDIKSLDDAEIAAWYVANKGAGHAGPFPDVGMKLRRFTDAFHKIYEGEKTFSEIKNIEGSKHLVFEDKDGNEIPLASLSTGEKQIIYRMGYILRNLGNISGGIVLIDEPEISLHPSWQLKLKDFLLELFHGQDVQIIAATHSPYIFQNLNEAREACIKIDRSELQSQKVHMVFPHVPYTPTVQLITYLAYGVFSEILHIELYTLLQIRENRDKINHPIRGIENWLRDPAAGNMPIYQTFVRTGHGAVTEESIMTWIRNKIHHADEHARPDFSQAELKTSIDEMIRLLG